MKNKKEYPLVLLKALESYVSLKGDKFEIVEPGDYLLKAVDKDPKSDFHFILEKHQISTGGVMQVLVNRKPLDSNNVNENRFWANLSDFKRYFDSWILLLAEYDAVNSFFDDPILKAFNEEFYAEFEILEDDADTKPMSTKQALLLDAYLDEMSVKLSEHINDQNAAAIQDIKEDIVTLKDNLTTKSKQWVATNMAKIWAKIAKQGTEFIKEFLSEATKAIAKQCVNGLIVLAQQQLLGS